MMKNSILVLLFLVPLNLNPAMAEEAAPAAASTAPAEPAAATTPAAVPAATPASASTEALVKAVEKKSEPEKADVQDESNKRYGKKNRPLGDFLVGPYVTGVAIPRPVSFGAEMKWKDVLGLSAGYGFFPQLTLDNVKLKVTALDFRFKVYPFKGSFSIGVGLGTQTFTGQTSQVITPTAGSPTPTNITLTQDNFYAAPQLGWNWIWDSGFFMGMDLGVQLSISRKTALNTDADALIKAQTEYKNLEKDVNDMADLLGKIPLPLLTLIKIGYFF